MNVVSQFQRCTTEIAVLAWIESLGWTVRHGLEIAPVMPGTECRDHGGVVQEAVL